MATVPTDRGPLLGWLLVVCCKTDIDTAKRRRKLRELIESRDHASIGEASIDNSVDVMIVVAQGIVGLYASMLCRRFLAAFSYIMVFMSAMIILWIVA